MRRVHGVLNDPGDGVVLVGDHGVFAQVAEGQLAEHLLGGDPFPHGRGGDARQHVSGAQLPGLVQDFLDRTECIRCPEEDGLQLHGCSTKKSVVRGRHAGNGGDPEGDGRASRRAPSDAAAFGKRTYAEASGPSRAGRNPQGAAPARRFPCRAGHSPPRKAAGPAPHGNRLRAYSQNSKPIGRPDGEGVPVPAATRGTAQRAAGTPSARIQPPSHAGNGCKPTFPAFSGKPAAHAGDGQPAGSHWRGTAVRTETGPGAPEASAGIRPRRPCGERLRDRCAAPALCRFPPSEREASSGRRKPPVPQAAPPSARGAAPRAASRKGNGGYL